MKPNKNHDYLNPKMVTIIITRKCTISCPMCFFGCSPNREEVIPKELALKAIEEINQLHVKTLGITGGEPFLEFDLMKDLVEKADSYGMTPIVVTNAHWATSEEVALSKLNDLRKLGLSWIQISLDEQHQRFIPLERVSNVIKAAKKLNFENIKVIGTSMRNSENFKYYLFSLQEVSGIDLKDIDLLDRPRVSHKSYEDSDQKRYQFSEFIDVKSHLCPKPDCLNEMMIDVNGDLYPCCNNFVGSIGNISVNTFQEIRSYAVGPEHIVFNTLTPALINLMCIEGHLSMLSLPLF